MKPSHLALSAIAFILAASTTLAIILGLGVGDVQLAFVVGAIVGSQAGAALHSRRPNATATALPKLVLGAVLAVTAVAFGFVVHLGVEPMEFPQVKIPFAAVGSFVFPFMVFNTMFNAMRQSKKPKA